MQGKLNTTTAHFETISVRMLTTGHVRSCVVARTKCIGTLTCSLAIAQLCLDQVFRMRATHAPTYRFHCQNTLCHTAARASS